MFLNKIYILIVALFLGLLMVTQIRSFADIDEVLLRDSRSNIFQEIKILKDKNSDLKKEIGELESTLEQLADQNLALKAIEEQINKYKKISGKSPIFGPGASIIIHANITTPWIIDLINEFLNSGAEAVSVNGIRITNKTAGFDTLPQGQILLNGSILSPPYIFDVIGKSSTIVDILELPGGIFDRLEAAFPNIKIETMHKDIIQMD